LPGGGSSARFHGDGMFKGPSITKGTFRGEAGGDLVTEDIAEFGADGQFVVVKFGGLHWGWGGCRRGGSCRSIGDRGQEFFDVAQEAYIISKAGPALYIGIPINTIYRYISVSGPKHPIFPYMTTASIG
jgi:hypothetical protein